MKTRNFHLFLFAFLGLGAIGGVAVLMLSPSGEWMGIPLSMSDNSPFGSFRIPGIVLFTIPGVFPRLIIYALIKKTKWSSPRVF